MSDRETATTPESATGFDRRNVLLISGAHLGHDIYPAFLGVLLPLLIDELGISLALAGILASSLRWTTSLQPLLGHWADHADTRYWVILTPALTGVCMSLLGVAGNSMVVLVLLLAAGLSHAAFHPAAGALATRAAGTEWGKGMSYFMTGGEIGRVVGPVLIAGVIGIGGLRLSPVAAVPGVIASLILWQRFRGAGVLELAGKPPAKILAALRSGALALYEVGAVAGVFTGGILSDRHGRSRIMLLGLAAAIPPMVGAVMLGPTILGLALLLIAGFLWLSASSIELTLMQQLLPHNRSTAVGVTYFMRAIGAILASILIGSVRGALGLRATLLGAITIGACAIGFLAMIRDPDPIPVADHSWP